MQGYLAIPFSWGGEDDKLKNRLEDTQEERAAVLLGSKVFSQETSFILSSSPLSFVLVTRNERSWGGEKKGGGIKKCERMMKGKDGVMDSAASRSPYVCVRACAPELERTILSC